MPVLGFGAKMTGVAKQLPLRRETTSSATDLYLPSRETNGASTSNDFIMDETARRVCSNVDCLGGWVPPWRSRRRPIFEGKWGCSERCLQSIIRSAVRRESGDTKMQAGDGTHRHRVPLGLVMLAQGWITNPQLQTALKAQRENGSGRIGDWLMAQCGLDVEQVTRALSVQWGCPVLSLDGFSAREMALVMPGQFVAEFGLVPLRVAGQRLLYLGCEDRLNASVAYAVEQMSGLKVESGLVESLSLSTTRNRLLAEESVPVQVENVDDEDGMVRKIATALEHRQPLAARLVRIHRYLWMRMWLESGTRGFSGSIPRSVEDMSDLILAPARRA